MYVLSPHSNEYIIADFHKSLPLQLCQALVPLQYLNEFALLYQRLPFYNSTTARYDIHITSTALCYALIRLLELVFSHLWVLVLRAVAIGSLFSGEIDKKRERGESK